MIRIKKNIYFVKKALKKYGCFYCGWKEVSCDVHHINGRKSQSLKNLTYACPNCHRLIHRGFIAELITIDKFIKNKPMSKYM